MAQNIVIDLDASTRNFERALDDMTAKVKSTASQMDKSFSFSGNAEKQIKNTSHAVSELHSNLKDISLIAAGNVLADGFEKALSKVKSLGKEIYSTTARMQSMEMGMKSLVTSDLVKTGQVKDYTEATKQAEKETEKLMGWFKELSLKSPYELMEVMDAFKQNANMGQSVETAKKTTEAILALGSGLGMGQAEMKRFSAALAQTGATGRITAMDLRQFANNGFGMDKMNAIFGILSERFKVVIKDQNDFNHAIEQGKFTTDDFFDALNTYALENYGGAVDAMASTIEGLKSSLGDIKVSAINDLFLDASKTVSKTLVPYVEFLMQMLTGGDFKQWGEGINSWVSGVLTPFQKIGETLESGRMMEALAQLKDFFSGRGLNLGAVKSVLQSIKGEKYTDAWFDKLWQIKGLVDKFIANKDIIIDAIKGIGVAIATALSVNMIAKFGTSLVTMLTNPVTWLIAAGAAFGYAWNKNLFNIQERFASLKAYVVDLYKVFKEEGFTGAIKKLGTDLFGADFVANLTNGIQAVIAWVTTAVANVQAAIHNIIAYFHELQSVYATDGLSGVFSKIWDDFKTKAEEVFNDIKERIKELLPESILNTLSTIWDWINRIGQAIGGLALGAGLIEVLWNLPEIVAFIAQIVGWLIEIPSMISAIANPVTLLVAAIIAGFAVLGQFVDFGQLFINIFNVVKNTVLNVVNGIIENVVPRIKGLFETIQPFITVFVAILATVGTILATIITTAATLVVGAINGIIEALDNILAMAVDAIDFIVSIIRLPFDIIIALFKIIYGVITGNNDMIQDAVQGLVDRLKHIWEAFYNFFYDLWWAIHDFFKGIWDTIVALINSVDISAGLERLFGEEVVKKVEDFKTKVVNLIDDIITAWLKMTGQLSGREVNVKVGDTERKISGTAYEKALYENNGKMAAYRTAKGDWSIIGKQSTFGNAQQNKARELYQKGGKSYEAWYGSFENYWEAVNQAAQKSEADMEAQLLQDWYSNAEKDIKDYWSSVEGMAINASERKEAVDKYIAEKYAWATEDPYMQSLLEGMNSRLDENAKAYEQNKVSYKSAMDAYSTNTEATRELAKATHEASDKPITSFYTDQNIALWMKASDALTKELQESVGKKSWNSDSIAELKKILATSEGKSLESLTDRIEHYVTTLGLGAETQTALLDMFKSGETTDTVVSMLDTVVNVLETGNVDLLAGIQTATETQTADYNKQLDETISNLVKSSSYSSDEKSALMANKPVLEKLDETQKDVDLGIGNLQAELEAKNSDLSDITKSLESIETIKWSGDDEESQKQMEEAKKSLLDITTSLGGTEDDLKVIQAALDDATTHEDIEKLAKNIRQSIENSVTENQKAWSRYYTDTQGNVYGRAATGKQGIIDDLKSAMLRYSPGAAFADTAQPYIERYIGYMNSTLTSLENGRDFNEDRLQAILLSQFNASGMANYLSKDTLDYVMDVLTADTNALSIDTLKEVAGIIVDAVSEAGVDVTTAVNDKRFDEGNGDMEDEKKGDWNMYSNFVAERQAAFESSYKTAIHTAMVEAGWATEDFAKVGSDKKVTEAYETAYNQAVAEVYKNNKEFAEEFDSLFGKFNGYYYQSGMYGNGSALEGLMGQRTNEIYIKLGEALDSFREVTIENYADASKFLANEDLWQDFAESVRFMGSRMEAGDIESNLISMMEKMADDPKWVTTFKTDLDAELEKLSTPAEKIAFLQNVVASIDSSVDQLKEDNANGFSAVENAVKNLNGGGTTTPRSKGQAALDYAMEQYDKATTEAERKMATFQIQAALDAGLVDKDKGVWGWNVENGRLLATDLIDQGKGGDVYKEAMAAFSNGFSEAIAEQSFLKNQELDLQKAAEQAMLETFGENLWSGTGTAGESGTGETDKTTGTGGILSLLFGNPEVYQGLAEILTPDVMSALQTLVTTEINADPWKAFSEALSTVATSFTTMVTALKGGDEGEGLTDLLNNVLSKSTELADYWKGDMATAIDSLMQKLALSSVDENGELGASGGNTLYNTWGWIYNLILDTYVVSMYLAGYWRSSLPEAVQVLKTVAGEAVGALQEMASYADGAAGKFMNLTMAVYQYISALEELYGKDGFGVTTTNAGGKTVIIKGNKQKVNDVASGNISYDAGGGTIFPYGTAIVGEHGPEIIRAGSSQLNVFANSELMGEIAHIRHAFNGLANSAEAVSYNRFMGGANNTSATDNSQHFENNFNGVMIGEKAMKEMIEDTVRETWRREMRLAS